MPVGWLAGWLPACRIYSPGAALYGGAPGGRIGPWVATGGRSTQQLSARSSSSALGLGLGPPPLPPPPSLGAAAAGAANAGGGRGATTIGGGGGGISGYAALGPDGEYVCAACYPSPSTSMQLGRRNLHVFRLRNTRWVLGFVQIRTWGR